ncbi:phosphatase PAP2 family protein [Saccharibacillus sp. O23]|uniref:phosphatase PAP2 family protein n=1 Tax=Saccharibacillus sp. O23 TaxID=2009338 RepID=UPI000B4E8318|nr:phosphatase PAP2 family protein [Saccharibacillus sp. O23]OWR28137.1 phosphatase PAP2 family protein [Saccharibacillus sp. O23]
MRSLLIKLSQLDQRIFKWINGRLHNRVLSILLYYLTHLGGATFTITATVLASWLAPSPWNSAALHSLVALAVSHVPVAIAKKLYPRVRPHLALPETNTFRNPLVDHSFPSGHTTAIFSVTVPLMILIPWSTAVLLPIALIVGISRMYLGLHYPSDVLAGGVIGSLTAWLTVALWP